MEFSKATIAKLMALGVMASVKGFPKEANSIMEGVREIHPDNLYVLTGLALAKTNMGYYKEAITLLQHHVLNVDPQNLIAQCVLGAALKFSGQRLEGEALLREVSNSESQQKTIAEAVLAIR
jgi:predicted Zn-dependent protease